MNFQIDRLSFLLGFVLASLAWFLILRLRSAWPKWKAMATRRIEEIRNRNLSGLENYLRQETIERAQRQHIAARMFPLEDLLVQPRLLTSPAADQSERDEIIPYLPDQPLLPSQYRAPSFTVADSLQNGASIVVIGRPGAGKTVALAHFAIQAARRQASPALDNFVPLYLHVHELELSQKTGDDPAMTLKKAFSRRMLVIYQNQVETFLRATLSAGRALLILDGVDELPPLKLAEAAAWLKKLRTQYPGTRMVATGDPAYLDGLLSAGFLPLALACWRPEEAEEFFHRWKQAWERDIAPRIAESNGRKPVHPMLLENWLANRSLNLSPLEWTAQTWGLFAGDLNGPLAAQAIEAAIRRALPDQAAFESLTRLAAHSIQTGQSAILMTEASLLIGEPETSPTPSALALDPSQAEEIPSKQIGEKTRPVSAGMKVIESLVGAGLLVRVPGDRIAFAQPCITGYLASRAANLETLQETAANGVFCWSVQLACIRYLFGQGKAVDLVDQLIAEDSKLLHTNLAWLCSVLNDSDPKAPWRNRVMRHVVQALQDDNVPFAARARLVSALTGANDPSIAAFFRQLLAAPSPLVRMLAALGTGGLRDGKAVDGLTALLSDPHLPVQQAACLALTNLPFKPAREAVLAVLTNGSEELRLAAAEALARSGEEGHEILREALASPDILLRRIAVLALSRLREPWVLQALEKTAIEDGQWIVRTAASEAIENLNRPDSTLPRPLPSPSEAGWLIEFAARYGTSVPRDSSTIPILLQAFQEGSPTERAAALEYLRRSSDPAIAQRLCEEAAQSTPLAGPIAYALWWMAAGGVRLPDVTIRNA